MNFLSQLFSGMTDVWLNVAFIVCVFGALLFKPDRINNISLFQIACLLFVLSLIAPSIGMFVMDTGMPAGRSGMANPFGDITLTMKIVSIVPSVLFAAAFFLAVYSLMPISSTKSTAPTDDASP